MASKILIFNTDARAALERGVNQVANAVKVTLGPRGRNVILEQKYKGSPIITKDGVTVAKEIELEDPYENMGAQLCKEVASKTNDVAGDGTTTATVLAQALVNEGIRYATAGGNPIAVKRGMDKAVETVIANVIAQATPVKSKSQIEFVATISGNNADVGQIVADAFEKVGKDGVITVEESGREDSLEYTDGMQFDRGYLSPYFINEADKQIVQYDDAYVLLHEGKISMAPAMLKFLEKFVEGCGGQPKPLLIIAEDVDQQALATLVLNRIRVGLTVVAVKAPGFGDRRKEMMRDLAILTGGQYICDDLGIQLENSTIDMLGRVKRVIVDKDTTTLVEGHGDKAALAERIGVIRTQLEKSESKFEKEKLQERLAKLSGGVAVIKVGASTETAMKEKKHRYEDAINATRAAIEEGIVPGGGVALLRASKALDNFKGDNDDEQAGIGIVQRALEAPIRQIALNAGYKGDIIVEKVRDLEGGFGLNAATGEIVDLYEAGIIDPVKVTRSTIENAASIVGLLLTTDAIVVEKPAAENPNAGMEM